MINYIYSLDLFFLYCIKLIHSKWLIFRSTRVSFITYCLIQKYFWIVPRSIITPGHNFTVWKIKQQERFVGTWWKRKPPRIQCMLRNDDSAKGVLEQWKELERSSKKMKWRRNKKNVRNRGLKKRSERMRRNRRK